VTSILARSQSTGSAEVDVLYEPGQVPEVLQRGAQTPTASVVICTYTEKRWSHLLAAIESIERQELRPAELIVVVDHNPTMLLKVRQELPEVIAVPNQQQRGLSGGKNTGSLRASGEIVAFLDDDAVAEPTWLARLLAPYTSPNVIAVGGRTESVWEAGRPSWFPSEFEWVVGGSYRGLPAGEAAVRNLHGGNMSIRRDVLVEIGGFRTHIGRIGTRPVGCEETELCIRARQRWPGREFVYSPTAVIHHHVPPERASLRYYTSRCYAEGVSKAQVTRSVGRRDGLSTERAYALRTLPKGVVTNFSDFVSNRQPASLGRAVAIVLGLAATAGGFATGTFSRSSSMRTVASERS
jgi:glucosyl-dolichyl phosphate glucuronosyltransferase